MNTSVDPHQHVTSRETLFVFLKLAMSSLICSANSYLFFAFFTCVPSSLFTYSWSNAPFIGCMPERNVFTLREMLRDSVRRLSPPPGTRCP